MVPPPELIASTTPRHGAYEFLELSEMKVKNHGLLASLAFHGWQFLRLRGDWKAMPGDKGFLGALLPLVLVGGVAEQWVRSRSITVAIGVTLTWMAILLWMASPGGRINLRLAAALALLSIVIQFGLIIASWVPMMEWPVAIWSGIALMHLISQGARDGAGTVR
jgi:hypothetical protein